MRSKEHKPGSMCVKVDLSKLTPEQIEQLLNALYEQKQKPKEEAEKHDKNE